MKRVVVVGGGTGTFVVLSGIKQFDYDISAVVTMMDSGGSTGRLRDQYGVVPPGDVRQCLVALSEASDLWRRLFLYRFTTGDFKGHNFGNIFLTALEKNTENYQKVVDTASYILQTKGRVVPVTLDKVHLCVQYEDGEIIETEELIDTAFHKKSRIKKAYLKPSAHPNKQALEVIRRADYIIIGPGDLYTSLIPNLVVDGIRQAVSASRAKIITIVNLMTKRGQTTEYSACDHVRDLERYMGREINVIIMNKKPFSSNVREFYGKYGEQEVEDDLEQFGRALHKATIVRADLLANSVHEQAISDKVIRSLVRHDSDKLAHVLKKIIK